MSNELEIHGAGVAIEPEQGWWNERQMKALQQLGIDDATQGDLLVFFHMCQKTGLDPFARQIHMVSRNVKVGDQWVKRWTIQTGIDGYRLVADRADRRDGTIREYEDTMWADAEGTWRDVWVAETPPTAAKCAVLRSGHRFSGVALYREFAQMKYNNGGPNAMWARMPANQLAKCAEALALRKAYPQDLSGLYTDEEMAQASNPDPEPAQRSGMAAALSATQVDDPEADDHAAAVAAQDAETEDPK